MLNFAIGTENEPKCHVTHGTMGHLDPKQPPVKRKPFAAILNNNFIQKASQRKSCTDSTTNEVKQAELILPEELYHIIKKDLVTDHPQPVYSRVILPLQALLEGDFFNEYIKKGNILMLSEGRADVDNVYSLREGVLTLHVDKESYERAGLVGKPDGVKGKRGTKPRWVIKIDLRLPSMLHGKKGFDRILYAFKNVLTAPVTWLFLDMSANAIDPGPLDAHFPIKKTAYPDVSQEIKVNMPSLKPPVEVDKSYGADFEDYALETHEWLSLVLLNSPRINPDDKIDSFLSRYVPPGYSMTSCNLVKIKWRGFLSPTWAHKVFVQALLAVPRDAWFAYCVDGFGEGPLGNSRSCTILKLADAPNEYVLWEIA